ncbi:MAG: hypothetical protein PF961_06525, partial [Planctomycetota bacterium]|nr:hypothetical protein [Planctomycetota bacterium]
ESTGQERGCLIRCAGCVDGVDLTAVAAPPAPQAAPGGYPGGPGGYPGGPGGYPGGGPDGYPTPPPMPEGGY